MPSSLGIGKSLTFFNRVTANILDKEKKIEKPISVCAGAAHRGCVRQHWEDQLEDPLEQPGHQSCGGYPGGCIHSGPPPLTSVRTTKTMMQPRDHRYDKAQKFPIKI